MKPQRIGILYPGAMGISIAASAQNSGHQVYWTSEGRSSATRERAAKFGLYDAGTIAALSAECSILLSVCPPHAAEDVAKQVLAGGFNGLYVDANAISPERTIRLGQMLAEAGVSFVDGGIIGEPAWQPNTQCLYLASSMPLPRSSIADWPSSKIQERRRQLRTCWARCCRQKTSQVNIATK